MPIEDYKADLEEPTDEYQRARLDLFGLEAAAFADLPSIVVEKQRKPVSINPRDGFDPDRLGDVKKHSSVIEPDSLLALKALSGVPQRAFETPEARKRYESPRSAAVRKKHDAVVAKLPQRAGFGKLDSDRKLAVWGVALDLLNGPADDRMLSRPGYERVAKLMLELSKLTLFVAPDLVVADGQSVYFTNYAVLSFTNVVVYGSGGIWLGNNTKLHAYSIKRV